MPRLRIDVVLTGVALPRPLDTTAIDEVTAIWAPYGVDIRSRKPGDAPRDGALPLAVRLADRPDPRLPTEALGSIDFYDGSPKPTIVLYIEAISSLVSETLIGRESEWPMALRDRLIARVLGRALAHEIGHFLLRSRGHSAAGLMRAHQLLPDLMIEDRRCCTLSADDIAALESRLGAAFRQTPP